MKLFYQMKLAMVTMAAAFVGLTLGAYRAEAGVSISMSYPAAATPCDSLSVTTRVVNTGATLSQLQISELLPGGSSYQYVSNSMVINISGGITITNEASVLSLIGGTNLVFNLNTIQTTNGPTNLVLSEVFPGATPSQSWFEIFNPTANPIALDGWSIRDARPGITEALPSFTLQPGQFLVVSTSTNNFLAAYPSFTNSVVEVTNNFNSLGLNRYADGLFLIDSNNVTVDKISWGFDTSAFNPSVPYVTSTSASMARVPANVNSRTAQDWVQQNVPDPGSGNIQSGLASGTTVDIIYQLTAKCGGVGGYFNASATYEQPSGGPLQTNSTVNFIAFENPVLLVSKTPQIQQASVGSLVTWQLQVRNSGFGTAYNTVLYDSIGSGLQFVGFSVNPVTTNATGTNAVYWDASVIPALAGLTNGGAPISVTVTALVTTCSGDLSNRGDASFGCDNLNLCQDTRLDPHGALASIQYLNTRPYLTFMASPSNPIAVSYCGGVDITLTVTNNNVSSGADAYSIGVATNLVPGYTLSASNAIYSSGNIILSAHLPKGTATNLVVHLQPGGVCPVDTNLVAQLITPLYSDACGATYENPTIALMTFINGIPSASLYEYFSPSSLIAGTTTNVTVNAQLVYTNMGIVGIADNLVLQYPTNGWGIPTDITGGGVLDTNAHTITWATNVTGSGVASMTFQISVTKGTNCSYNGTDYFPLTPAVFYDCAGCPENVTTNSLVTAITTTGGYCPGTGGSNCTFSAYLSSVKPVVEPCESQPFTLVVSNISGSFPNGWSNVVLTASLSGGTYAISDTNAFQVLVNGYNVTTNISYSLSGGTLSVHFDNLTNSIVSSVATVTNIQVSWDGAASQSGNISQFISFNLCSSSQIVRSWLVANSSMSISLTPPFLGFECGILSIPIGLKQLGSPNLEPDYDVDVVLNLDPNNDPNSLGIGTPVPNLAYITNSSTFSNIITNAGGFSLIVTNEPVVTNNLVIWHLGNLGVFTNGTVNSKFQLACGGAAVQHIQATLRYNNRCEQGSLPQTFTNKTSVQLVSDQASSLQATVSPSLIPEITTNFNFLVQVQNTKAAPAHNFFIELQVPTNIVLTKATVPWNYVYSLNGGTNAYRWNFTTNTSAVQGLVDDLGDGIYNDLGFQGSFSLSVTGVVVSCAVQQINTIVGSGCLGGVCQQVGPLPVNFAEYSGKAVSMLVFPTVMRICETSSLYYDVRNASVASIYNISPSFYLPRGVSYVPGSAVVTDKLFNISFPIPDPPNLSSDGAGTVTNPFVWTESQIPFLTELVANDDVIVGFQVSVACDTIVNGQGGASASYYDTCRGFYQTPIELSAGKVGLPVLSISKGFYDLGNHPKTESNPGETNIFHITIQPSPNSDADVQRMELSDVFPTNNFSFLGASIPPDSYTGGVITWSNSTLMASIPNQSGGPYAITSAPISLVITCLTLVNCSSPAINTAVINYGCAEAPCQSASASASVVMTANLQFNSPSQSLLLNSCGGTYSASIKNNGAPAYGIVWTNFAPAGYLIAAASISGDLTNAPGQVVPLILEDGGKYAILNLSDTNAVISTTNYPDGTPGVYLGPGQSIAVTFTLVSDGSTLNCTVNDYPASPAPVTVTNAVTYNNYCGSPANVANTFTTLPDQPRPGVDLEPKSLIVTNGQVQDFTVTVQNIGAHGNAANLQARVFFQSGWTNIVILGVTNNSSGGSTNTGSMPITLETNAQNGVLADLGGVILEPLETVVIGLRATATQGGNPLAIKAEVVGSCGMTSPNACSTFTPTNPLAMTMPPSLDINQVTNHTIYGFYQDNGNGTGFTLDKTVRYANESAAAAGTNRIARIGENLVYRITAQFFDAPFTNIVITDSLPPNLVYGTPVDAGSSVNVTNWVFNSSAGTFTLPTPVTSDAVFAIDLPVIVTNGLLNQSGVSFTNTASVSFLTVVTNVPPPVSTIVTDIEPTLNVSTLVSTNGTNFNATLTGIQAGDTIYYQIVITNDVGTNGLAANAYDLWLSNSLPAGFTAATVVSVTDIGSIFTNGVLAGNTLDAGILDINNNNLNLGTNEVDLNTNSSLIIVISAKPDYTVQPNQVITNATTIQWSSLPGYPAQARTGGNLIPNIGVNESYDDSILNNYAATSAADVTTDAGLLFTKDLVGTDHTSSGNGLTNAVIGELVSYTLTLTVPQGTTPNATIVDTLPSGLAFVDVTNVTFSPNVVATQPVTVSTAPANTTIATNGGVVTFNLGNVTNMNNNDLSASVAITFRAVVLDVLSNQAGTNLVNTAQFTAGTYTTNVTADPVTVVEPTLAVSELVATNLAGVPGIYGTSVNGLQGGDTVYYQIVITNVPVTAGGNGTTAYNLWVSNTLPAGLTNVSVYAVVSTNSPGYVYTNGVLATNALSPSLFAINNNVLTVAGTNGISLDTNGTLAVVVAGQVSYADTLLQTLTNNGTTIQWSSLPAGATNLSVYNPNANARTGVSTPLPGVGVNNSTNETLLDNYAAAAGVTTAGLPLVPSFGKVLVGTTVTAPGNGNTNAVIGELVSYQLTVSVPQGTTPGVLITDTLPSNLAFVGVTNVSLGANVSSGNTITVATNPANTTVGNNGQQVVFNLGNVVNTNSNDGSNGLVITFTAVVLDVLTNQAGTNFINSATFAWGGSVATTNTSGAVTVVEPTLAVSELVATNPVSGFAGSVTHLEAGDTLYYQIVITNTAGINGTTAYNLWVSNTLPAGLTNVSVYAVTSTNSPGYVYTNGVLATNGLSPSLFAINNVSGTNVLTVAPSTEVDLNTNGALTVVVAGQISAADYQLMNLTNNTAIAWSSLSAGQTNLSVWNAGANERTGGSVNFAWATGATNFSNATNLLNNYAALSAVTLATTVQPNSLSGLVFADLNRNGILDNIDYPITNVTITLTGVDDQGTMITMVEQTLTNGTYGFTNLPPGTYTIAESQPSGYSQGTNAVGSTGGTNSAQDVFSGIALTQNQNGTAYNFGEIISSSIAGFVYADTNNDGVKQVGESGLGSVTVTLTGTNLNGVIINQSTNTAGDGSYSFGNLIPGNYVLTRTTTPSGYLDGKETVGTLFGGVVNNATNSTIITSIGIPIGGSLSGTDYDFGLVQANSLSGMVFADLNRDGVKNGADYAITNVTVTLTGTDDRGNVVSNVLQTLADGSYDFTSLRPSTNYTITETQPAGYGQGTNSVGSTGGTNSAQDVISGIALTQNQNGTAYNFGETVASFGNYVWNDVNADGVKQAAERGIGSVLVYLDTNHDGIYQTNEPSVLTDTNGCYIFTNLLSGTYTVRISTNTLPLGASETYDLDGTSSQNVVTNLVILPGTNRVDVNFGYRYVTPTLALLQAGSFRGIATKDGVELNWNTISEVGTADFIVNSKNPDGQWEPVSFTLALDSITGGTYTSWDVNATVPGTYEYQLVEEQMSGADLVLANCSVVVGDPIYLTIRLINTNTDIQWSGGVPPYRLFVSTDLNSSSIKSNGVDAIAKTGIGVNNISTWMEVPLSSSSTNEAVLPTTTGSSFFRVTSGK